MELRNYKYASELGGIIWGLGSDYDMAIEDGLSNYRGWLINQDRNDDDIHEIDFNVYPISPVLAYAVWKFGGEAVKYVHCGDMLMLYEEKDNMVF